MTPGRSPMPARYDSDRGLFGGQRPSSSASDTVRSACRETPVDPYRSRLATARTASWASCPPAGAAAPASRPSTRAWPSSCPGSSASSGPASICLIKIRLTIKCRTEPVSFFCPADSSPAGIPVSGVRPFGPKTARPTWEDRAPAGNSLSTLAGLGLTGHTCTRCLVADRCRCRAAE